MPKKLYLYFLSSCFILLSSSAFAQKDTVIYYLKNNGQYVAKKDSADIIRKVIKPKEGEKFYMVHDVYPGGSDKLVSHSDKEDGSVLQGYSVEFYENGTKKSDENFINNMLTGSLTAYYPNGKLYLAGDFTNGQLLISQCRDTSGHILASDGNGEALEYNDNYTLITARGGIRKMLKTGVWSFFKGNSLWYTLRYDQGRPTTGIGYDSVGKEHPFINLSQPAYFKNNNGDAYGFVKSKLRYPSEAKKANIRGTVHVTFTIEKNGALTDVKVTGGLGHGLDEEAVRVIKLMARSWSPAIEYGLPVRQSYNMPVNFGLDNMHSSFQLSNP